MLDGKEQPFQYIPNGIPGLETRLPLLFSGGVAAGRIDIHQFVALTATNPAKMYGLYPRKGSIMIGADADIALWNPEMRTVISNDKLHHNVDYTPYEGIAVQGWPVLTLSRGKVVYDGKTFSGAAGAGEFLPCGAPII
jgi:dihydropyrimidinase